MSTYEISKSSLLSLKAEISRKQQELSKAKVDNELKKNSLKKQPLDIKNKGVELREKYDKEVDEDLLKKSRSILEQKAQLYEKLSAGKQSEKDQTINSHYLVQFDKKKSNLNDLPPSDSEPEEKHSESDDNFYQSDEECNPLDKWVDYVDFLGRTRRCMQKDLQYLQSKDQELGKIVEEKEKQNQESEPKHPDENINNSESEIDLTKSNSTLNSSSELLSTDMRREMLRQQWEKEEEALLNKTNVHYQDLLFGEARTHGVGYYSFSKDEEERIKQQVALKKLRAETEMKQKKAQELRNSRGKLLASRLKAARNRKRARLGLPPEEDEPEPAPTPSVPEDPKKEEEEKEQNRKESILAEARKNHVRPWDVGKDGVKEHQLLTQEEWVDQQREERPKEFAPPMNYNRTQFRAVVTENNEQHDESTQTLRASTKKVPNKSRQRLKRKFLIPLGPDKYSTPIEEIEQSPIIKPTPITPLDNCIDDEDKMFQDHKNINIQNPTNPYKPHTSTRNKLNPGDFDDTLLEEYERIKGENRGNSINRHKGVEIAPPVTYDYYGPSSSKIHKGAVKSTNIQDSIEAGLKFLRKQVEEREKSSKHMEDMFLF